MDMSWSHLWNEMGFVGKSVVIMMLVMSVYSLWVMVERFIVFQRAKNQSLKLLGALSNLLTKSRRSTRTATWRRSSPRVCSSSRLRAATSAPPILSWLSKPRARAWTARP